MMMIISMSIIIMCVLTSVVVGCWPSFDHRSPSPDPPPPPQIVYVLIFVTVAMLILLIFVVLFEGAKEYQQKLEAAKWACSLHSAPTFKWNPAGACACPPSCDSVLHAVSPLSRRDSVLHAPLSRRAFMAGTYACFLSHYKIEAASDCRYLHGEPHESRTPLAPRLFCREAVKPPTPLP